MATTEKLTPRQRIAASVTAIKGYQEQQKVGNAILGIPEVQKNDSTRTMQEALVRGARENEVSEYNAIFRRVTEHADGMIRDGSGIVSTSTLEKFAKHVMDFRA